MHTAKPKRRRIQHENCVFVKVKLGVDGQHVIQAGAKRPWAENTRALPELFAFRLVLGSLNTTSNRWSAAFSRSALAWNCQP